MKNILPRANIKGFIKQFFFKKKKAKRLMSQKEGKEKAQSRVRGKSDGAGLGASLNGELQAG